MKQGLVIDTLRDPKVHMDMPRRIAPFPVQASDVWNDRFETLPDIAVRCEALVDLLVVLLAPQPLVQAVAGER